MKEHEAIEIALDDESVSTMRSVAAKNPSVKQLVDRILVMGQITRLEHLQLTSTLLSAQRISSDDRVQINRVFDLIQTGRLKFVD